MKKSMLVIQNGVGARWVRPAVATPSRSYAEILPSRGRAGRTRKGCTGPPPMLHAP
jgi:hypothetical protein